MNLKDTLYQHITMALLDSIACHVITLTMQGVYVSRRI